MKTTLVKHVLAIGIVMAITTIPALANHLTTATATDSCSGFTLSVQGADEQFKTAKVHYVIELKPTKGTAIKIHGNFTVAGPGNFSGSVTETWSAFGVTLGAGPYTLTGTAHLAQKYGNTIAIVFTPDTISGCGGSPIKLTCPASAAQVGVAYSSALSASGGVPSYTFSISTGALPPDLSLNSSTGAITGSPTTAGSDTFTGKVVDSDGNSATASCTIVVSPPPGSCQPSSSLGLLVQGKNVNSYIPNGAWDTSFTGLSVVPVEGSGSTATISTPNTVNSCASDPLTGETVCTSNLNDVYLITGSTLNTTLSSGGNEYAGFSGGECITCGVAMNAAAGTAGQAVVTVGLSTAPSGSGLQFLDLASSTFGAPVPLSNEVSEDVLWDQGRDLVLSPNEGGVYDIYNHTSGIEFANAIGAGEFDSAAEECSTGIALSTIEFTDQLYITDLTQATFTAGTPGTWSTTAQQVQSFPEFSNFAAGTDGIAIAQGSHLGIATGEFGGNWMGVIQLPATSGSGTPSVLDYAAVALPNTPDGNTFEQGLDPHTVTAYVSPNSGDAIGLMANGYFTPPTWLAVIDLTKLLAAPRTAGTNYVDPTYDLILNGVVSYIAVP
jgi:hypothetical protein